MWSIISRCTVNVQLINVQIKNVYFHFHPIYHPMHWWMSYNIADGLIWPEVRETNLYLSWIWTSGHKKLKPFQSEYYSAQTPPHPLYLLYVSSNQSHIYIHLQTNSHFPHKEFPDSCVLFRPQQQVTDGVSQRNFVPQFLTEWRLQFYVLDYLSVWVVCVYF